LDAILDTPITVGKQPSIDPLYECMPATPGKYLLLLSYASRILKEQLDSSAGILGDGAGGSGESSYTELDMEEPPIYATGSGVAQVPKRMASDAAYRSAYALPSPPRPVREGFSASGQQSQAQARQAGSLEKPTTDFENQLAAWKVAFDTESMSKIEMYIRYCNKIFSKIDTIKADVESGSIFKKMDLGPATAMAKSLMATTTSQPNLNIPL
jgi:hypothetical protein